MEKAIPCTTRRQGEMYLVESLTQDFAGEPLLSIKVLVNKKAAPFCEAAGNMLILSVIDPYLIHLDICVFQTSIHGSI